MITRKARTILLSQCDLLMRKRLSNMLRDLGHRAVLASSDGETLSAINDRTDLLILDLAMPDMGARGLLGAIREKGLGTVPVIAIGPEDDAAGLEELGVVDCIRRERLYPEVLAFKVNRALFIKEVAVDSRKRVPVSITAVFTIEGKSSMGILMNLSEGGAFLHTGQMLAAGSHIELTFYLDGELMIARGVVRWSAPGLRGNLFSGSGVMFNSLPGDSMRRLSEFIKTRLKSLEATEDFAV